MGPDWVLLSVISFLGLLAVAFGVHGFRAEGIPFSRNVRIMGIAGKIVGAICLALGLAIVWFAGRVFGPKEEDTVAHAAVRMFPFGVAAYAAIQIFWILLPRGKRTEKAESAPPPKRSSPKKKEEGIIEYPQCGKRMVDTAQERCRFCGGDLF
jgi:hypothetical protein